MASMPADVFIYSTEPYAFELPRDLLPSMNGYESAGEDWCRHRDGRLSMLVDAVPLSWYPSQTVAGLKLAGELRERVLALTGRRR
ncbi:MAG: hypothetical protein M5R36_07020 [Deltaproteobacteria bacterium]|nr:hypothetical protein [Deltaproteobacteria bacterium]